MTPAQRDALDVGEVWRRLTIEQQADIGTLALRMYAAETVSLDTDPTITVSDRRAAVDANSDSLQQLGPTIERCAPFVPWFTP